MQNVVALNAEDVAADFADQVAEICPPPEIDYPVLVTLSIPAVSPLRWLAAQKRFPQFYWQDRSGQFEVAGCGSLISERATSSVADCLDAVSDWVHSHPQGHQFTFFGGVAFGSEEASGSNRSSVEWAEFPQASFTQPEVVVMRRGEEYKIILGTRVQHGESVDKVTRRLARLLQKSSATETSTSEVDAEILEQTDIPKQGDWNEKFASLLGQLDQQRFEKVVVARRRDVALSNAQKPVALLEKLMEHQETSYSFLYAPSPLTWFASKSPECLFRFNGDRIESDALGGTAPLSHSADEDERNAEQLKSSSKVLNEHRFVVEDVERKMLALTDSLVKSQAPELVALSHVQHLRSSLAGTAKQGLSIAEILNTLHPTAAVCGYPTASALKAIAAFEPFERGWYAGPVGMITADSAEFAVALRCMLGRGKQVSLYAGAGIVPGSTASEEWQEIDSKMSSAMELFTSS